MEENSEWLKKLKAPVGVCVCVRVLMSNRVCTGQLF